MIFPDCVKPYLGWGGNWFYLVVLVTIRGVDEKAIYFLQQSSSFEYHLGFDVLDAFPF